MVQKASLTKSLSVRHTPPARRSGCAHRSVGLGRPVRRGGYLSGPVQPSSPVIGCCERWNRSRKEGEQVVRFRVISMLAAGLMLVGGALGSAQAASSSRPTGVVHSQARANPASVAGTLYDQNNDDNGIGISSQNFEAAFDAFDDQGADDFKIGKTHVWKVKQVNVTGV